MLTDIFQMGWNHQLVVVCLFKPILPWDSSPFFVLDKEYGDGKSGELKGCTEEILHQLGWKKPAVNKGINYLSTGSF